MKVDIEISSEVQQPYAIIYTAEVTKEIMEAYFGLNEEIVEDKTAKPYTNL